MNSQHHVTSTKTTPNIQRGLWLDKFSIALSGICIVHCLITPIAITLIPLLATNTMLEDVLFHKALLWLIIPSSCIALFIGCTKHRNLLIAGTGITGMLLLVVIAFFAHDIFSPVQEKLATSFAGLVLASSHIFNYRTCQKLTCKDDRCNSEHHH